MSLMGDLVQLIERDIPVGRKHLKESHGNLENVAAYCEENYLKARDKRHALEETKNYTTQSLASVAYQINTLATNFLHLLDLQMNQLSDMESGVNHIAQTVSIHKEKVARREIGVLTTNKTTTRPPGVKTPGIIFPDQPERPVKYVRKGIDYAVLDEIGHGVKQVQPQNPVKRRTSSSSSNKPMIQVVAAGQAPTTKPPTPPTTGIYSRPSAGGTLSRQSSAAAAANSPYRSPAPPVSPPTLPSHYAPNYPKNPPSQQAPPPPQGMGPGGDRRSGYAPSRAMPPQEPPPAPPTGMVLPMSHEPGRVGYATHQAAMLQHQQSQNPPPTPPLPPMPDEVVTMVMRQSDHPPPPPPQSPFTRLGNTSPPLPPPPESNHDQYQDHFAPPPPPSFNGERLPSRLSSRGGLGGLRGPSLHEDLTEWKPKEYIEKVLAIYDYHRDKEDELTFSEGAVIYVVKKNDDGWWEGVMDGVTGLFPGNYVEPCI